MFESTVSASCSIRLALDKASMSSCDRDASLVCGKPRSGTQIPQFDLRARLAKVGSGGLHGRRTQSPAVRRNPAKVQSCLYHDYISAMSTLGGPIFDEIRLLPVPRTSSRSICKTCDGESRSLMPAMRRHSIAWIATLSMTDFIAASSILSRPFGYQMKRSYLITGFHAIGNL